MTLSIHLTEYEGNVFAGWLDVDGIDQEASIDRYYGELERRLQVEWPEAVIRIERQARTMGPTPDPIITGEDLSYSEERSMIDRINQIGETLYEDSQAWVIERSASQHEQHPA